MAFKIEERFEVKAPVERVWKYLIDPQRVVHCLPGAELLEQQDERTFLGAIKVKVGPLSMSYKGQAKFTEINEETHQARMVGDAREVGGSGSTKVSMLSTVAPLASGGCEVLVNADIDLVGKIVQFGRGMIEEVSRQMFRQFSTCVRQQLEVANEPQPVEQTVVQPVQPETKPVAAAPLAFRALWAIIVRFFKRLFSGSNTKALIVLFAIVTSVQAQTARRTMAVTIDDLPYVKNVDGPYVARARAATSKILNTLKKHKVPAIGFVNEGKLEVSGQREERIALLRQWVEHGMTLGNHTYSHPDLNRLTVEQFEEEIAKGDVVTRQLMRARQPYQLYFRHPMTHTGDTPEKKEAIERFLATRGYKVTPHTIENSDFIFNVPYGAALQKKDEALAQRLREEYIAHTIAATEFAEKISPQVFGREIPQTLLIHVNDITADCLDEMLTKFEERGYTFVTLDAVMADPTYQTKDTFVGKHGPSWLFRWMKSKGMDVDFAGDPEPPKWIMDSYNKIQGFTNQ
jgi:carbon monoxide dehydrogenase subunit G/peptidoglycan/xylan/chitin deacetylase (PgdA/CDA1 family)